MEIIALHSFYFIALRLVPLLLVFNVTVSLIDVSPFQCVCVPDCLSSILHVPPCVVPFAWVFLLTFFFIQRIDFFIMFSFLVDFFVCYSMTRFRLGPKTKPTSVLYFFFFSFRNGRPFFLFIGATLCKFNLLECQTNQWHSAQDRNSWKFYSFRRISHHSCLPFDSLGGIFQRKKKKKRKVSNNCNDRKRIPERANLSFFCISINYDNHWKILFIEQLRKWSKYKSVNRNLVRLASIQCLYNFILK